MWRQPGGSGCGSSVGKCGLQREPWAPRLYRWWLRSACREARRRVGALLMEASCGQVQENQGCQGHSSRGRRDFPGSACRALEGGGGRTSQPLPSRIFFSLWHLPPASFAESLSVFPDLIAISSKGELFLGSQPLSCMVVKAPLPSQAEPPGPAAHSAPRGGDLVPPRRPGDSGQKRQPPPCPVPK